MPQAAEMPKPVELSRSDFERLKRVFEINADWRPGHQDRRISDWLNERITECGG